ncbi:MAG: hypothetical protein K2Q12_05420 [Rickettsiales bacterium]|nr:hypothetical protein [Rickettsiales bacterium]
MSDDKPRTLFRPFSEMSTERRKILWHKNNLLWHPRGLISAFESPNSLRRTNRHLKSVGQEHIQLQDFFYHDDNATSPLELNDLLRQWGRVAGYLSQRGEPLTANMYGTICQSIRETGLAETALYRMFSACKDKTALLMSIIRYEGYEKDRELIHRILETLPPDLVSPLPYEEAFSVAAISIGPDARKTDFLSDGPLDELPGWSMHALLSKRVLEQLRTNGDCFTEAELLRATTNGHSLWYRFAQFGVLPSVIPHLEATGIGLTPELLSYRIQSSDGRKAPTVMELVCQAGQLGEVLDTSHWLGRARSMEASFALVPEAYQTDLRAIRQSRPLLRTGLAALRPPKPIQNIRGQGSTDSPPDEEVHRSAVSRLHANTEANIQGNER